MSSITLTAKKNQSSVQAKSTGGILTADADTMLLVWTSLMVQLVQIYALQSNSCGFNSMCTCSPDQHDLNSGSIHTISCLSVPFYKFPSEYECQSYVRHSLTDLSFDVLLSNAISTE
ncbi:hypothetical protein MTP99_013564 [Tenebrio molitor]|nr:hypothetical protein MTP99_013564 [Tenebrio molitor]